MTPSTDKKLSAKELAAVLGVSESTIHRLKQNGRIPFIQPGGKNHFVRFSEAVLETFSETDESDTKSSSNEFIPGPAPKWMNRSLR